MLVATGVSYRLLDAPGLAELTGRGVFYGASASDAASTKGDDVYIVGAANSAGQAALHLARFASRSCCSCRGDSAGEVDVAVPRRADHAADNIDVRVQTEIGRGGGDDHLEWLTLVDRATGDEERRAGELAVRRSSARCRAPTGSATSIARDSRGFILTGPDVARTRRRRAALAAAARAVPARDQPTRACSPPATSGSRR